MSLNRAALFVKEGAFQRVALQFPQELLSNCVRLTQELEDTLQKAGYEAELHVLADSAYDSASVDTVAAEHVQADCVIHFGVASLAEKPLIPTYYVFQEEGLEDAIWERLREDIAASEVKHVVIFLDHSLEQQRLNIMTALLSLQAGLLLPQLLQNVTLQDGLDLQLARVAALNGNAAERRQDGLECYGLCGFEWELPKETEMESCFCVWIGPVHSELLTHLQLHLSTSDWISVDVPTSTLQHGLLSSVVATIKRRPFLVEKARDADIIAILVSTVSVGGILDTVNTVKRLAEAAGKHVYEIVVAKPNPAKLANFPEVDVFVLVCDPLAMILDTKEFLAPCITPYEAQIAFTGQYLAPKQYRYALDATSLPTPHQPSQQLIAKLDQTLALSSGYSASDALKQRQFRGLEQKPPSNVSPILPGRSGRASGYEHEAL